MEAELGTIFRSILKGKNVITPYILEYIEIPNGIVEISKGTGFKREPIWGITVVLDGKHNSLLSKCVWSLEEVEEYINELKS